MVATDIFSKALDGLNEAHPSAMQLCTLDPLSLDVGVPNGRAVHFYMEVNPFASAGGLPLAFILADEKLLLVVRLERNGTGIVHEPGLIDLCGEEHVAEAKARMTVLARDFASLVVG